MQDRGTDRLAPSPTSWLGRLPQGDWLTRDRILAWSGVFLVVQLGLLAFVFLWAHGVFAPLTAPMPTDFVSFYGAGRLTLAGAPALAYVQSAHHAAEVAATAPGMPYVYFYYPPVYLLWCALLALPPLPVAFVLFQAISAGIWLLVMRSVLRMGGASWALAMLAYPAVSWTLLTGQNAFVVAGLLGAATLLLDRRPVVAGLLLGTLCFKPHLALVAPIALAAGGYWRTFAAAALAVGLWIALSGALFGVDIWRDYLAALGASSVVYETGRVELNAYVTVYGAVRVLGGGAAAGHAAQAVASVVAAGVVAWIWRRDPGPELRGASLAAGMLATAPMALMYDLLLLSVTFAWLVRLGLRTGFRPWEKLAMFACFAIALVSRHLAMALPVPLGPLAPAAMLALCLVRTLRPERGMQGSTDPGVRGDLAMA